MLYLFSKTSIGHSPCIQQSCFLWALLFCKHIKLLQSFGLHLLEHHACFVIGGRFMLPSRYSDLATKVGVIQADFYCVLGWPFVQLNASLILKNAITASGYVQAMGMPYFLAQWHLLPVRMRQTDEF